MTAHSITAHDMASALTGKPGAAQSVHVCTSVFDGSALGPLHIVLVIEEGQKRGSYYECSDRDLALLRSGISPEDLEMEPLTEAECEAFDNGTYWERW